MTTLEILTIDNEIIILTLKVSTVLSLLYDGMQEILQSVSPNWAMAYSRLNDNETTTLYNPIYF